MCDQKITAKIEYHKSISNQLRSIETNSLTLITTTLGSGLPFLLSLIIDKKLSHPTILVCLSMLIIYFGILYLTSLSYSYRQLMMVLCSLEKALELCMHTPNWKFKKVNGFEFYPEGLKAQSVSLLILTLFILIVYTHLGISKKIESYITIVYLQFILQALFVDQMIRKYNKKLTKRNKEIEQKNENCDGNISKHSE